jgi:acyl-CoA synthetase (AMP-forming)/AMP-acid ligase II
MPGPGFLIDALRAHAQDKPDAKAFSLLSAVGILDASITYAELHAAADTLARRLSAKIKPGERALLMFPPGLHFVIAFFGCLYAGIIAVPTVMPRRGHLRGSTVSILRNCNPSCILTVEAQSRLVSSVFADISGAERIPCIAIDGTKPLAGSEPRADLPVPTAETIAFLQYTSGSTSQPKGVMVSHRNVMSNLEMITEAYQLDDTSTRVGWIPHYHDMGLIFNILQSVFVRAHCVLMAPTAFVQHPWNWLKAISECRAELALAPNSAYDLCVETYRPERLSGVDLSCWKLAINGAEPVRAETLERFSRTFSRHGFSMSAFHPGYGMAEATLVISGGRFTDQPKLARIDAQALQRGEFIRSHADPHTQISVGCGKRLNDETIAIVDPVICARLPLGRIGEIWVHGPHVALGYWENAEQTRETFHGRIVDEDDHVQWLRTGDLGCLDETGELFITGRLKDTIIIRGQNYSPQDIELTAEKNQVALRPSHGAAFSLMKDHQELLILAYEVRRSALKTSDYEEVVQGIRKAVVQEYGLAVHDVAIVRTGTIAKTTSGKIRRLFIKQQWQNNELDRLN